MLASRTIWLGHEIQDRLESTDTCGQGEVDYYHMELPLSCAFMP